MYDFTYGGVAASSLGVYAVKRPNVPVPERNVELIEVQGMDGSLTVDYGTYKDVTFPVPCNFMSASPDAFESDARKIRPWLLSTPLLSRLEFTDDAGWCRIVKKVSVGEITRQNKLIGTFDVTFTCDPYMYSVSSFEETDMEVLLSGWSAAGTNSGAASFPLVHFIGEGSGSLAIVKIGGDVARAEFALGQDVYIDTARQLAYNNNGDAVELSFSGGDWDDFIIRPGAYAITAGNTGDGVTAVKWAPRWRTI